MATTAPPGGEGSDACAHGGDMSSRASGWPSPQPPTTVSTRGGLAHHKGTARSGDTNVPTAGNASPTGKSKGGGAAASADNDGDVAAVIGGLMRPAMGIEDETSTGWCLGVTSLCVAVGSTGPLLLDRGSDEHLCRPKFADLIPTGPDRSTQTQGCATERSANLRSED